MPELALTGTPDSKPQPLSTSSLLTQIRISFRLFIIAKKNGNNSNVHQMVNKHNMASLYNEHYAMTRMNLKTLNLVQ